MTETPNHGYNVPEEGTQDWHVPLNENFEQYDTDIEIRDDEENLDDYEPTAGAKFLATDTGVVYVGDGSEWEPTLVTGRFTPGSDDNPGSVVFGDPSNGIGSVVGATVSGGRGNTATGNQATISGGSANEASGILSSIGGGFGNEVDGFRATVPGGDSNHAEGNYAFAAGRRARANHNGSFVWSSGTAPFTSSGTDQFLIDAAGGVGIGTEEPAEPLHVKASSIHRTLILESSEGTDGWGIGTGGNTGNLNFYNAPDDVSSDDHDDWDLRARIRHDTGEYQHQSDARLKRDIEALENVLEDVCSLDPKRYRFKQSDDDSPRSLGFLAQEVQERFPELVRNDEDDEYLGLVYDGFAALAIQAIKEQQDRIDDLEERLAALEKNAANVSQPAPADD